MTNHKDSASEITKRIQDGNSWYVTDQIKAQLDNLGIREQIKQRWGVFEKAIILWFVNCKKEKVETIRMLDAGCGDGINLLGISEIAKRNNLPIDIFALDYNQLRIERSHASQVQAKITTASIINAPFKDSTFEIILCNHVLEHIPDDSIALASLKRMLKDDGIIILGVPNERCAMARIRNYILQPYILFTTDHCNFYTLNTFTKMIKESGFQIIDIQRLGFFTPVLPMHMLLIKKNWGRKFISWLGNMWPSQSADLIVVCKKE